MSTKKQAIERAKKEGITDFVFNDNKPKRTAKHYVKNDVLRAELIKCKEQDELTSEAVEMFQDIATKLSTLLPYTNPDDRDDCIGAAVLDCISYWRNYDPAVSENAFAYFTSVCRNGFAKGWRQLGKIKWPDSLCVSINEKIFSL